MGLTFDEFKKLKAENRIRWNANSIQKSTDEVRDFIGRVSDQSQFKGNQWTDDEYNSSKAQAAGMRNRLRALEVYANSIKDKDESAYKKAIDLHSQLSGALDQTDEWFKSNDGDAFKNNWENYRQSDKAQKLGDAVAQMKQGKASASDLAEKNGLDEDELNKTYSQVRQYEKQTDRAEKYNGMSFDKLTGIIKDKKNIGKSVYELVNEQYKYINPDQAGSDEKRWEIAFDDVAGKFGLSGDEVKELYNDVRNDRGHSYDSYSLSDEDKSAVFSKIIETGSAKQLKELKASLPSSGYYDGLRKQLDQAIEEKSEDEYYLRVKEKYPNIEKSLDNAEYWAKWGVDVEKYKKFRDRYNDRLRNDIKNAVLGKAAEKAPVAASLASVPLNTIGSIGDVPNVIRAAFDNDYYYDPKGTANYAATNIRSTVSNKIDNPGLEFLYNTGMSMGDSAVGMAASYIPVVGKFVSSAMFFSSAGVNAANEVIENGGTPAQAAWTMLAQGSAELVFENVSLEKLKALQATANGKGGLKQLVTNTLKQSFTEGSEEVFTSLANSITDGIINGDLSAFERNKQRYIESGMSEEEANAAAVADWWKSIGMDFAGGALSGGIFGAGGSAKAKISYNRAMKNTTVTLGGVEMSAKDALEAAPDHFRDLAQKLTENKDFDVTALTEIAKEASEDGKARALAESIENTAKVKGRNKITAADVENLLTALYEENIDARVTGEHVKSAMAWAKVDGLTRAEQESGAVQEYNDAFDLSGQRRVESSSEESGNVEAARVEVSSFGKAHPNGIAAFDKSGKNIVVKGVESVVNEYGKQDRTVSLMLDDGSTVDADEVEFTNPDIKQLVELAKSYDTIGARALLSNYEDAKAQGVSLEAYKDAFAVLYDVGQDGTDFEYAVKNPKYAATIQQIGTAAAQAAVEAGNHDAEQSVKTRSFMQKQVKVPGKPIAQSRVAVERGIGESKLSEEAVPLYQHLAERFGKDKVLFADLGDSDYGMYVGNRIIINVNNEEHTIFVALFHEGAHWAKVYDPEGFRALQKFIYNYYAAQGVDIDKLHDDLLALYPEFKNDREALREEIVCKAVESLTSDSEAFKVAAGLKENSGIIKKVGDFLKKIADRIMTHFKGDKELRGHNEWAQAFLDDHKALMEMAELCNKMYETARANEKTYGSRENKVRFAKGKGKGFTKDKYFDRQIDKWEDLENGSRVKVGVLNTGSALNQVGFPATDMWFDVGKIKKAFSEHSDHVTEGIMKQIPDLMNNPIAITEYRGSDGTINNTVNVYGIVMPDGKTPVAVGVVMVKHRNGKTLIDKIRTVHARSNAVINDDNILYLNEDKKKTRKWFQVCGNSVPLEGKQFGFIRSISYVDKKSNTSVENNLEVRKSKDDTIYLSAVERGDMETQQFKRWFDNSKVVDKDGKPLVVYHQTDADFTVFDTESNGAGRYDDETPSGIFLKPSDNDIGLKGKKQMALYASIKNPLTVRNREELVRFYEENVDGYEEKKAALRYIDTEYSAKYEEASKRADEEYAAMHRKLRKKEITREEYDNFAKKEGEEERVIKEWEQAGNKASAELKALVTQFFKNSDYDGIIIEQDAGSFGRSTKTFIALEQTQVKSATDNIGTFDKSNPDIRYSKDDTIYLSAVERGDMETAQRMVDEAARAAGYDLHLYHGSKSGGGFTVFKDWQYFTANKSYAERYTQRDTGKGMYSAYVKADRIFDTRNADDRALFEQYRGGYGMSELQESGLPDWTDGYDLSDIIEENDLDYDGIVLDEGGDLVNGKPVSRGESYVIRSSEQVKSADPVTYDDDGKVIPLSQRFDTKKKDIRYSKDDTIYDIDEDELWSDYEETHALDEIDPETGWTIGEVIESEVAAYNERRVTFNKLMEQNPDEAALIAMQATAKTIQRTLRSYNGVKLSGEDYERIARKVMRQYGIKEKGNEELVAQIAADVEEFVGNVKKFDKGSMTTFISALAAKCRKYLENSGSYERNELQKQVKDFILGLRGQTLILDKYDEDAVLDNYDDSIKRLRRQFRGYVNIGLKEDEHKYKHPIHIDDVLDSFADIFGDGGSLGENNYLFPNGERPFSIEAWQWLADMIEFQKPKFVNLYLSGEVESIESAALEMAYELATEAAATKGENAAKAKNLSRAQAAALMKERNTVKAEQKALYDAKKESYKRRLEEAEKKYGRAQERYQKEHMRRELAEEDLSVLKALVASDTKNFRQQYISRVRAQNDIEAVRRNINKLRTMIMNPTNEKFIPAEILHNKVFLNAVEALGEGIVLNNRSKVAEKMAVMLAEVRTLKDGESDFDTAFDDEFTSALQNVADWLKLDTLEDSDGTRRKISRAAFSNEEIGELRQLVDEIVYRIENARKLLMRRDGMLAQEASEKVIRQTRDIDDGKAAKVRKMFAGYAQQMMNPLRAVNQLSNYREDSELKKLFYEINEGQRKRLFWEMNAEKMFAEVTEKYEEEYRRACNDVIHFDYTVEGKGYHLDMTMMQALQVMMTWRREAGSNMNHMRRGGIVVADPKVVAKGKGRAWENAQRVPVSYDLVNQIIKKLGKFEEEYIKTAENYFNKISKDAINETFMVTRHREIARAGYYIPVKVDQNFSKAEISSLKFDFTIEGAGSYKHITPHAPQPIMIESLNSVIDRHITQTGKLYGLDIPLINFKRMFKGTTNFASEGTEWFQADSVKKALSDKFGSKSVKYIEDTIAAIEGGRDDQKRSSRIAEFLYSTRVKTSLVGNLGVVIKQAASFPTAGLYLSAKDLSVGLGKFGVKALSKNYKNVIKEIDAHTAQHYQRRKGLSVQEVSDMLHKSKLARKAPTPINPVKWIQAMDCVTTAALWEATKANIDGKYKKNGKQTGTDEYWQDVTKLYDTVIEDTQPMYDELHRSEFQKDGTSLKKFVFPFITQPMQNMGILADAAGELLTNRDKSSAKKFAKAVSSQMSSLLIFSVMTFAAALMRHKADRYKDDEDKLTVESVLPEVMWDMLTNGIHSLAPVGGDYAIPLIQDVANSIENNKLKFDNIKSGTELSLVNDWFTKMQKATNILIKQVDGENKAAANPWDYTWRVLDVPGTFSEILGVPYSNISLLFKSAGNYVKDTQNYGLTNNYGELKTDHITNHILNAYEKGDSGKADKLSALWVEQYMSEGKTREKAQVAVNNKISAGLTTKADVKEAAQAKTDGALTTHKEIKDKYLEMGISEDVFDKAVRMLTGESKSEYEYTYQNAVDAYLSGDKESYQMAREELISTKVSNGKTREEAEKTVDSELKKRLK